MAQRYSTTGYRKDSKDNKRPYNLIPGKQISMTDVLHPVYGIDAMGNSTMMYPGQQYQFQQGPVFEIPVKQQGGKTKQSIYVSDKNDPRYQKYQDSLNAYLISEKDNKKYSTPYSKEDAIETFPWYVKPGYEINGVGIMPIADSWKQLHPDSNIDPQKYSTYRHKYDDVAYSVARYKKPMQPVIIGQPSQPIPQTGEGDYTVIQAYPQQHIYHYPTQQQADSAAVSVTGRTYAYGGCTDCNKTNNFTDMKRKMPYMQEGGVLPVMMPGMFPTQVPVVMNQHATTTYPMYAQGGYYQKPGYHFNGQSMVKTKGTGTYNAGTYFQMGGLAQALAPFMQQPITPYGAYMHDTGVGCENDLNNYKAQYGGYMDDDGDVDMMKKGGWIQKATKSIKARGTEGVCTGSKFGSSSCPPGSKRYNLAKTFRKMAKSRKKEDGGYTDDMDIDPSMAMYAIMQLGGGVDPWAPNGGNSALAPDPAPVAPAMTNPDPNADERNSKYTNTDPNRKPLSPQYATNDQVVDASNFNNPYADQSQKPQQQQSYQRSHRYGQGFNNLLGAGLATAAFFEDRRNQRNMQGYQRQLGMSSNMPVYVNQGGHGNYDQWGAFRPDQRTPSQTPAMNYMQYGGYQQGGTYELTEDEINKLVRSGYKVARI